MPNTITIMGDPVRKESVAAAVISPGSLIERASATTVQVHSTSGGNAQKMFALEDELQGKEISDDYAAAARVLFGIFRPGDEVYARLADGQAASVGDPLESNGDGTLKVHTPQTLEDSNPGTNYVDGIVAYAKEALDLASSSGASGATADRIIVEIA